MWLPPNGVNNFTVCIELNPTNKLPKCALFPPFCGAHGSSPSSLFRVALFPLCSLLFFKSATHRAALCAADWPDWRCWQQQLGSVCCYCGLCSDTSVDFVCACVCLKYFPISFFFYFIFLNFASVEVHVRRAIAETHTQGTCATTDERWQHG